MDNAIYATLSRQSGLMREMRIVANNIANADTTGFRREGAIFAEHMRSLGPSGETLAMADLRGRAVDLEQAEITLSGGQFDLAVEGEGFFLVQTPEGNRLTRNGSFLISADGELVNNDGHRVLDAGESAISLPRDSGKIAVGTDGTISSGGITLAKIGLFLSSADDNILHAGGTNFDPNGSVEPTSRGNIRQGFLENSNVDPIFEVARMIEVQRSYEMGQKLIEREDERIRSAVQTMTR